MHLSKMAAYRGIELQPRACITSCCECNPGFKRLKGSNQEAKICQHAITTDRLAVLV